MISEVITDLAHSVRDQGHNGSVVLGLPHQLACLTVQVRDNLANLSEGRLEFATVHEHLADGPHRGRADRLAHDRQDALVVRWQRVQADTADASRDQQHRPPAHPGLRRRRERGVLPEALLADPLHCASHSRYFWGLRLHLVCTLSGLPVTFALAGAKAGEQETLLDIFTAEPRLLAGRPGQTPIGDKNYFGADFQTQLAQTGAVLLRPARKGEPDPAAPPLFKPLRQTIESINQTLKGQLDLERHGRHTCNGVAIRVLQRILALTAVIWHNDKIGAPIKRSLIAYDH